MNSNSHLVLHNDRGLRFSVPVDLSCISTFVLLEQGRWFEKELDFVYRVVTPGSVAIDIGANIGVYTIPVSHAVGPTGRVIAYEPGGQNRQHLLRALDLNRCENVEVSNAALSNSVGTGTLKIGYSGELNQLVSAPGSDSLASETVPVTTLDMEMDRLGWPSIQFLKMDAEGQEIAIVRGGQRFFSEQSPLILFEIKHGQTANVGLVEELRSVGFDTYRLLGDGSLLVPVLPGETPDGYELNYFAAKPATADHLESIGLLVRKLGDSGLTDGERREALARYCDLPFAQSLEISASDVEQCPFGEALICYAAYSYLPALPSDRRLALLLKAERILAEYIRSVASAAALLTYFRVAMAIGEVTSARQALHTMTGSPSASLDQPFFPPRASDERRCDEDGEWIQYAANESLAFFSSYSFLFSYDRDRLHWLEGHALASPDLLRRDVALSLTMKRDAGEIRTLLARLPAPANAAERSWREAVDVLLAAD